MSVTSKAELIRRDGAAALIEHEEEEREAAILQARLEAADELERGRESAARGERQRRLNEHNKRKQGWA